MFIFLFPSCTTDAYDKGEGEYSNLRGDLADLQVNAKKQAVEAVTDEDERLTVANPFTTSWIQKGDTTYRAYIYYNKESDGGAEVITAGQVLVLRPRRESEPKSDPTGLESIWLSTNKKYLNMSLLLKVGQGGGDDVHHVLGATFDTLMVNPDRTRTLHLHLYHDQGGVPEFYTQRTYCSIPTTLISADSIHLRVNTYEGWRERTVALK
ncbi:MAG: NigD-like protein [Prevotella sp.]|nr:NigD-like protein [Prevotella sp.]